MSRARFVLVGIVVGPLAVGGCSHESVPSTTEGPALELAVDKDAATICSYDVEPPTFLAAVGRVVTFRVDALWVTRSCHCASTTTTSDYVGCGTHATCESEYDLGTENPTVCEPVSEEPVVLERLTASAIEGACTVTATVDANAPSAFVVSALCTSEGDAELRIGVVSDHGYGTVDQPLRVTSDGSCTHAPFDAGGD